MKKEFSIAIVGAGEEEFRILKNSLESASFEATLSITRQDESSYTKGGDTDLTVYCQAKDASDPAHVPVFVNKTLFITSCYDKNIALAAFKKGASHILYRPLHRSEILIGIRNLLFFSRKYWKANLTDAAILSFLGEIANRGITVIEPVPSPFKPTGHFYPEVLEITGELEDEEAYLGALAEKGFFSRKLRNRVRLCTLCESYQINYREVCPVCSSIDIVKGQMVHHFECGHIDSLESFKQGTDLVCPKCEKILRHIGIDYEKPSDYFKCANCHSIVPEPSVELQCLVCGLICSPEKTMEKNIYAYELTEFAWEALRSGKISGVDLGSILYDHHTNLYNRQYFEIELNRELIRMKRYRSEFTLVMARIEKIDEIRSDYPDKVAWYVNSIFTTLSKDLRELDTTCVWEANTLGIILAGTNLDGAKIVIQRIHDHITSLEYLYDIRQPEVSFSVIAGDPSHGSTEQITGLAMDDLADA